MSTVVRACWTDERDMHLVDGLLEQVNKVKRADSGFKRDAWTAVTLSFNTTFNVQYTTQQLKSRIVQVIAQESWIVLNSYL
jgi:hypothetical protein